MFDETVGRFLEVSERLDPGERRRIVTLISELASTAVEDEERGESLGRVLAVCAQLVAAVEFAEQSAFWSLARQIEDDET